ncbi:MAG TPA: CBS domain-containing protein [Actinomycetes bacterium]|jgi:CBS-domain-containing membrane protein|nr:CBS domain-containing protein [Actinomycetes bacterium]
MQRTVQDVMTRDVVVAHGSTPFHELVELLSRHHLHSLPVVDDIGHVVGIVCESDLVLKKVEALKARSDPSQLTTHARLERAKAAGITATQLMTAPVVTVYPQELVADAARRLHAWKINQLPVIDRAGTLIGIVSRADVLKIFLRADEEIRFELLDEVAGRLLRLPADQLQVDVDGGVVTLAGQLERRSRAVALVELAGLVDGVVAVRDQLTYEQDDLAGEKAWAAQPAR